jgi:hypothetical protein
MSGGFENWEAYLYDPSMAAAVIFIVLYGGVTGLHTYHLFRTRTWFFIPMVLGGYCECPPPTSILPPMALYGIFSDKTS